MDIFGRVPEKQSNNEKRLEAAIVSHNKIGEGWWEEYLTEGWEIWCERQYKRPNPRRPEWPFFTDFRLCIVSPGHEQILRMAGYDPVTDVNVEADGDHHAGMNERERDYFKDAICMPKTPTIRFGPQRIFKESALCIEDAVRLSMLCHNEKLIRAGLIAWYRDGWSKSKCAEIPANHPSRVAILPPSEEETKIRKLFETESRLASRGAEPTVELTEFTDALFKALLSPIIVYKN